MKTVFLILVINWAGYLNGIHSDSLANNQQGNPPYWTDEIEVDSQEDAAYKLLDYRYSKKIVEARLYLVDLNEPSKTEIELPRFSLSEYKKIGIARKICPSCKSRNSDSGVSLGSVKKLGTGAYYTCLDCKHEFSEK